MPRSRRQSLTSLRRRPARDWVLLGEALANLLWARLLVSAVPFRRLAGKLGERGMETPAAVPEDAEAVSRKVEWSVQAIARHVPLGFVCLPQAIAAKWMLRRRGWPSTLYLGVAPNGGSAELPAHAWLRVGGKIVTGEAEAARHVVVLTLGDAPQLHRRG